MKLKVFIVVVVLAVLGLLAGGVAKFEQKQKQLNTERTNVLRNQQKEATATLNYISEQNKQILSLNSEKTQLCVLVRGLPQFAKNPAALPAPCQATASDKQN